MPSLYETITNPGDVSSSNFTTLYNASGLAVPNAGAGAVTGNLNVSGNLTVQGSSNLIGPVIIGNTLSTPNYTFPLPDGSTDQVMTTDGNGNLFWANVQSLPGVNYQIEATTATGGANLRLYSSLTSDSVKFAEGTNINIVRTDANTITISTVADNIPDGTANGQVLTWENSAWTATPNIVWDTSYANRTTITGKIPAGTSGRASSTLALIDDTTTTAYTSGDGAGVLFAVDSDSQSTNYNASLSAPYYPSTGTGPNSQFRLTASESNFAAITATSITGGNTLVFSSAHGLAAGNRIRYLTPTANGLTQDTLYAVLAAGLTTTQCEISLVSGGSPVALTNGTGLNLVFQNSETTKRLLNIDQGTTRLSGGNLVLFANRTPLAAANATISVVRGSSGSDATITWNEGDNRWNFNSGIVANGNSNILGDLYTTGTITTTSENIYINSDSTAADSYIYFKGLDPYIRYHNADNQFELNKNITAPVVYGTTAVATQQLELYSNNFSSVTLGGAYTTTSTAQIALITESGPLMKITMNIKDNVTGAIHGVEMLAIQSAGTVQLTTYAELYTSGPLATFAVDQSGGLQRLLVTPASSNSTTFKYVRLAIEP